MSNVHTPERQPNETQAQYRERQAKSKLINQRMTLSTPDAKAWAVKQNPSIWRESRKTQRKEK